jgi:nickel transport protein
MARSLGENMRVYLWIVVLALLTPHELRAHGLGAECSLKNGNVHVEAFFDDDSPAVNAVVEVRDSQEKSIASGKTDAKGLWSFPAPPAGQYFLVVDAGMGHKKRVEFSIPGITPVKDLSVTSEASKKTILSGATREELTRFPYLKVGLGLGVILLFGAAFSVALKRGRFS